MISVGVGPTPLLYFAAHHLGTEGAVMITASHNPAPDNGFKLMRGKASFFGADVQALADRMERGEPAFEGERGDLEERDLSADYIASVRQASRLTGDLGVRVVLDAGNGSAGPLGVATLRALGFDLPDDRALYCDIDGRFPNHHPDPTVPENLVALRRRVVETGALLGVAWDGDGDRLGVVDEAGEIVWGDKLLLLFARALLREHPGATVLGEVKCSETLYADIEAHGGRPLMWKTGHSLIKTKMKQENALLAGEVSGHMFFADRWPGFDDAIYATVRLLEIVAHEGKGLRELLADVPVTFATPEIRVDCPDALKLDAVQRVLARYRPTHRVIDIDGARVDFGEGAWGLCRASNTGPILVLRFEAASEARRDAIRGEVEGTVTDATSWRAPERPPTPPARWCLVSAEGAEAAEAWTIRRVLGWAADDLKKRGISSPRLDAELLLCKILSTDRVHLLIDADRPLAKDELGGYRELHQRRRAGEPVAYLLGVREFYGRPFLVDRRVLIPRPDTEHLVEVALARTRHLSLSARVLDLCTGSGCVAVSLGRERPTTRVIGADVSPDALAVAAENALRLGAYNVGFVLSDLFSALRPGRDRFDLVTANPPYISGGDIPSLSVDIRAYEPRLALDGGPDGLDLLRRIVAGAPAFLDEGGVLAVEIGSDQGRAVQDLFTTAGYRAVALQRDYGGLDRVVSGLRPSEQKAGDTPAGMQHPPASSG